MTSSNQPQLPSWLWPGPPPPRMWWQKVSPKPEACWNRGWGDGSCVIKQHGGQRAVSGQ